MLTDLLAKHLSAHDIPEPPPADPLPLFNQWLTEAHLSNQYADANAMSLATASPDGVPSVRMVLCKSFDQSAGTLTFYSNYLSRKGLELAANPRASALFHWPHAKRQARVEGIVERLTGAESDAYFRSRPVLSRIGACISPQSTPINSRAQLVEAALALARSAALGQAITRPDSWGGYKIRLHRVELWSGFDGRLHQRALWHRSGPPSDLAATTWLTTLLAP